MLDSQRDRGITRIPIPDGKVLVVDDVITNLDVAKGLMTPYILTIHCASSGKQAIEIVKEEKTKYDAIFMDHMMPEMDGIEATRVIREEIGTEYAKTVPIIALTANALVGSEKIFLENGFQAFLSKPIDAVKLDEILNVWVRKERIEDTLPRGNEPFLKNPNAGEQNFITKHHIEGVDLAAGLLRFGKEDTYMKIIHSYVTNTTILLGKLRTVSAETLEEYAVTVHGIKGSSYGIGANAVGKMAEDLESAAKKGQIETVKSDTDAFVKTVESLLFEFRAMEKAFHSQATSAKKFEPAPDRELLGQLLKYCVRYDVTGMEGVLFELERHEYETQDDLIVWLRKQLDCLEYDNIRVRLENEGLSSYANDSGS